MLSFIFANLYNYCYSFLETMYFEFI